MTSYSFHSLASMCHRNSNWRRHFPSELTKLSDQRKRVGPPSPPITAVSERVPSLFCVCQSPPWFFFQNFSAASISTRSATRRLLSRDRRRKPRRGIWRQIFRRRRSFPSWTGRDWKGKPRHGTLISPVSTTVKRKLVPCFEPSLNSLKLKSSFFFWGGGGANVIVSLEPSVFICCRWVSIRYFFEGTFLLGFPLNLYLFSSKLSLNGSQFSSIGTDFFLWPGDGGGGLVGLAPSRLKNSPKKLLEPETPRKKNLRKKPQKIQCGGGETGGNWWPSAGLLLPPSIS